METMEPNDVHCPYGLERDGREPIAGARRQDLEDALSSLETADDECAPIREDG